MRFNTRLIHAGIEPDPSTGAIMTPIFQTSTYVQDAPGVHKGFEYARTQNPTRHALEENLAALEYGVSAICFGSGLAAMDAILKTLSPGDEIIASDDLYGGSYRLMTTIFKKFGIKSHFTDMGTSENVARLITPQTKMLWIETPTNPMLKIVDIKALTALAHEHQILTCVDNTFASPFLQNPLNIGADMVIHSATKYLGGHSDVVMGAVVVNNHYLGEQLRYIQNAAGAVPGPMDCFLVLRGIKTLHLRVQRACENAAVIAEYLTEHPAVNKVYYPGLPSHPGHEIAKTQMRGFGGMISFDLKSDTIEAANKVLASTKLFSLAESLGGVESLIGHPVSMTHGSIPQVARLAIGLTDSLIRLSVGVEDIQDLLEDLDKAFAKLS